MTRTIVPTVVRVQKRFANAVLPKQATTGAAGMDLHAYVPEGFVYIQPGRRTMINTGIAVAIPPGFEGQVRPRSGTALKHGITVLNTPGTIDSDYRGPVGVIVINHGTDSFKVSDGDRIAQLVIVELPTVELLEVEELDETVRGDGGFGSTGR
jgi:dUTP diphosphatase